MKPRWRRSEEKVITDEFSRTSRLDEAINAQRGIATPSSASLAVFVRAGREEPILLIYIRFLSFYPGIISPPIRTIVLSPIFTKLLAC